MSVIGDPRLPREQSSYARLIARLYEIFGLADREFSRLTAIRGETTWDPPNIAVGGSATTTVTAPSVKVNDYYAIRIFPPYTLSGLQSSGYVSADNTVTVVLANQTAGAVNLGSGTWRVIVERW